MGHVVLVLKWDAAPILRFSCKPQKRLSHNHRYIDRMSCGYTLAQPNPLEDVNGGSLIVVLPLP